MPNEVGMLLGGKAGIYRLDSIPSTKIQLQRNKYGRYNHKTTNAKKKTTIGIKMSIYGCKTLCNLYQNFIFFIL